MSKIKVCILTRDKFRRIGIANTLIQDRELVVLERGNPDNEIETITKLSPDVVVLDITTVKLELAAFIEASKQVSPGTKILMIGTNSEVGADSEDDVISALLSGVTGYLNILFFADSITAAVKGIYKGDVWISHMMMGRLIDQISSKLKKRIRFRTKITEKERKVLQLLATEGLTNKEIAARMRVQVRTVEFHITNLLRKFHLSNRNNLIIHAIKHNLVSFTIPSPNRSLTL